MSLYLIAKPPESLDAILNPFQFYTIPLDRWITTSINFLVDNFRPLFQAVRLPISWTLEGIEWIFVSIPPLIFLVIIVLIAWQLAGRAVAIYSLIALTFIGFLGAWEQAMISLSLIMTAVVFCMVVGIPLGIVNAKNDRVEQYLRPFLDAMQTLPSFVYLVPVVMLFGIGKVPGVIATIIFAIAPLIRLTNLGLRQVSEEVVEAAIAFGSTPLQMLWEVEIPLAMPTILAGMNQAILMALSMSVVTSMIAVPGLGDMVLQGVNRLEVGLAAVGGLGIVLLAIMLDRITLAVGKADSQVSWQERGPLGFIFSDSRFRLRRLKLGILLTVLLIGFITYEQNSQLNIASAQGVKVRPSSSTSSYGIFSTEVINFGLEKLGYEVETSKAVTIPIGHISVANEDLDFYGTHWRNLQKKFYLESGGANKLERIGNSIDNALQGYQIDKKTAEEYNITNLEQLKDPKIAQLFDSDGDGLANLTGCNAGWGCELAIEHHLDAYGLRDTVEHEQGQYDILIADVLARQQQGKPVLYYTYTPYWLPTVLKPGKDVIWLEVPFTSLPKEQGEFTEEDTSINGKNLGFAVEKVQVLANKKFIAANPTAKRLFELIEIPIEDINAQQELVHKGEGTPADIRRHAREWIENNQEKFDGWLESARTINNEQ